MTEADQDDLRSPKQPRSRSAPRRAGTPVLFRLRAHFAGLDRPWRIAFVVGLVLVFAGVLLAALAPGQPVTVPAAVEPGIDVPALSYVRSLPDAGDPLFSRPVGLAVGGTRLYVADSGAGVVRVFTTAGIDAGEVGRDILRVPAYLARDVAAGTLLVTDRELNTVFRFSESGTPLGEIVPSTEPSATWQPLGVAADGGGRLAVTDTSERHRVLVMDRAGLVVRTLGGPLGEETAGGVVVALDFPNSVGFWGEELWVGDSNNRRVLVFGADGEFTRLVRVDGIARGLAFMDGEADDQRYAAVVDALSSEIVLLDPEGAEVARYGGPGSTAGRLAYPNDVVYDPGTQQLFVADTGNARVQVWSVAWPGERPEQIAVPGGPAISPMRLAGVLIALVGLVMAAVAVWPSGGPKRRRGPEIASPLEPSEE
ncbi:MAG: NHL repeat-containing protein [Coriobacteriia bacterium]|nr:NHL repeat-containing protein [Coriobacteriia bacterium]